LSFTILKDNAPNDKLEWLEYRSLCFVFRQNIGPEINVYVDVIKRCNPNRRKSNVEALVNDFRHKVTEADQQAFVMDSICQNYTSCILPANRDTRANESDFPWSIGRVEKVMDNLVIKITNVKVEGPLSICL
jgi:hypothetical protein